MDTKVDSNTLTPHIVLLGDGKILYDSRNLDNDNPTTTHVSWINDTGEVASCEIRYKSPEQRARDEASYHEREAIALHQLELELRRKGELLAGRNWFERLIGRYE